MSWLARSIANSLRIDGDGDGDGDDAEYDGDGHHSPSPVPNNDEVEEREGGDPQPQAGVKDDLTEFRNSLTRQFRGVANFLAPPPDQQDCDRAQSPDHPSDHGYLSEFGGVNHEGCTALNQFSLPNVDCVVDEEEDVYGEVLEDGIDQAVGLTDEVLTFAGNIGHHPETWLDFPVEDEEDLEDFPMSEAQKRHARAIEHLTPRLAALRIELCPTHMSEGFFWKVYFVLLHSRLNKQDAELLSTPEVVEARAKWMQELHNHTKKESEEYHIVHYPRQNMEFEDDFTPRSLQYEHSETLSSWTFPSEPATSSTTAEADSDYEKQLSMEMQSTNKSNINEEKPSVLTDDKITSSVMASKRLILNFDDDDDDWPEDDCLGHNMEIIPVGIEEEVSFSDLEDDDCCIPVISKPDAGG